MEEEEKKRWNVYYQVHVRIMCCISASKAYTLQDKSGQDTHASNTEDNTKLGQQAEKKTSTPSTQKE